MDQYVNLKFFYDDILFPTMKINSTLGDKFTS